MSLVWYGPRIFSCKRDAKEFRLKVTYCRKDCLFTGSFVFHRQLELRLELLRFWGLSSAVSTQSFRRPALTRINAIFTFITNQHSNAERRTRVCMNDKLLNWTYLLWIEGYPADISIMVVWVFTLVLRYYSNGQPSHSWVCCLLFTSSLSQGELTVIRRWVNDTRIWRNPASLLLVQNKQPSEPPWKLHLPAVVELTEALTSHTHTHWK